MPYDFQNKLEWDLVARNSYQSQLDPILKRVTPIPLIPLQVDRRIIAIGMTAQFAKPNWYLGGYVNMFLLASPSSTSIFSSLLQASQSNRIPLNKLKIIEYPEYNLYPLVLQISPAKWHEQVSIEVWKYSGPTP